MLGMEQEGPGAGVWEGPAGGPAQREGPALMVTGASLCCHRGLCSPRGLEVYWGHTEAAQGTASALWGTELTQPGLGLLCQLARGLKN